VDTGVSSSVLFVRGGDRKVLAVTRRDGPGYLLPGGDVAEDETPKICACRALYSTVGCLATPGRLILAHTGVTCYGREMKLYYCCKITGEPRRAGDGVHPHWLTFEELVKSSPLADFYAAAFPEGVDHLLAGETLVLR